MLLGDLQPDLKGFNTEAQKYFGWKSPLRTLSPSRGDNEFPLPGETQIPLPEEAQIPSPVDVAPLPQAQPPCPGLGQVSVVLLRAVSISMQLQDAPQALANAAVQHSDLPQDTAQGRSCSAPSPSCCS